MESTDTFQSISPLAWSTFTQPAQLFRPFSLRTLRFPRRFGGVRWVSLGGLNPLLQSVFGEVNRQFGAHGDVVAEQAVSIPVPPALQ